MWGIRAIRVGVLLCGVLATIAGCSCQNPWVGQPLIPSRSGGDLTPRNLQSQEDTDDKDAEKVLREWKRNPADWGFKDQMRLTPERVHGGIY